LRLLAWLARQVCSSALILLGASFLLFALLRAAPGDAPYGAVFSSRNHPAVAGTDETALLAAWLSDYGAWLSGVLHGDFGRSSALQTGRPVAELLAPATARSLALAGMGLLIAVLGALGIAVYRWARPYAWSGAFAEGAAHLASTLPVFLWVYVVVSGGNGLLAWGAREGVWFLPAWFPLPAVDSLFPWLASACILALGDGLFLDLYYRFHSELGQAAQGDHLVGARLLGASVPLAVARGMLPGATTHLARRTGFVLGSLVVLESALGWSGLGHLAWRSAAERDLPVLLGVAVVLALVVRVAVLAAEAVWYAAEPRRRSAP
jgi:peptide/nickel transport system permease protein